METVIKKIRDFLGPHPYNPPQIFLFFWAFYLSRYIPLMVAQPPGGERWKAGATILLLAFIPATAFSVCALLWDRFRPWPANKLRFYLLELFLSVTLLNLGFAYLAQNPYFETVAGLRGTTTPPIPTFIFLNFVFTVFLFAGLHQTESKIQRRLAKADSLVSMLETESRVLILAEAELKNQVSQFLHDRVQSSLMVISMRLENLAIAETTAHQVSLKSVIADLESLRMQDVRLVIESLSPNLESTELSTAISGLVSKQFSDATLEADLPQEVEAFSADQKMAIYKISEQAILNSQMHGMATHIWVSLDESSEGIWVLKISDDGIAAKAEPSKAGLGTAVIDTWTRVMRGTKRIEMSEAQGYVLEITFDTK